MKSASPILVSSAILGASAVAVGAFGAHALKDVLDAYSSEIYQKASAYHFYHSLALLGVGILANNFPNKHLQRSAVMFVIGILLFSGSLYTLAITGVKSLGMITPFGGLALMAGWVLLALGVRQQVRRRE